MPALAEKLEKVVRVVPNAPWPIMKLGSLGKAHQLFGSQLPPPLDEVNTALAA